MKKVFHYLSGIFCFILIVLGGFISYFSFQNDGVAELFFIFGIVQCVWAFIMFVVGVFLPKEPRYLSKGSQRILKFILALSLIGGRNTTSLSAKDVAEGRIAIQRFWEPAFPMCWFFFEIILFTFSMEGIGFYILIASEVCSLLLVLSTLGWSICYRKEKGNFRWINVIVPTLLIIVIFGFIFGVVWIRNLIEGPSLHEKLTDTQNEINRTLDSYDANLEDNILSESDSLSMDDIISLVRQDFNQDMYYRLVVGEDDTYNMIVWNDDSDEITVYQFRKEGELYHLIQVFQSTTITKEDVVGKEDGVISIDSGSR